MKKLSNKKLSSILLGLFLAFTSVAALGQLYFFLFVPLNHRLAHAQEVDTGNANGYAWSGNFGWVSFNCKQPSTGSDTCGVVPYGVTIDPVTKQFSGYAWSSNVGWIYFGPEYGQAEPVGVSSSSAPSEPRRWAYFYKENGRRWIDGWAKVLALGPNEGWIKFSSTTQNMISRIEANGRLSGWGWDGDATGNIGLGWLSLSSVNNPTAASPYYVYASDLDGPTNSAINAPNRSARYACDNGAKNINITWTFNDGYRYCYNSSNATNGQYCRSTTTCDSAYNSTCTYSKLHSYEIVFNDNYSDSPDDNIKNITTGEIHNLSDETRRTTQVSYSTSTMTQWGRQYYVWVQTTDEGGEKSEWTRMNQPCFDPDNDGDCDTTDLFGSDPWVVEDHSTSSFMMPRHQVPLVEFTWSPRNPSKEEIITFNPTNSTSTTGVYTVASPDVAVAASTGFHWVFNNGNPSTSNNRQQKVQFSSYGNTQIDLTLTDGDGYYCSTSTVFNANLKLPTWKEENPK